MTMSTDHSAWLLTLIINNVSICLEMNEAEHIAFHVTQKPQTSSVLFFLVAIFVSTWQHQRFSEWSSVHLCHSVTKLYISNSVVFPDFFFFFVCSLDRCHCCYQISIKVTEKNKTAARVTSVTGKNMTAALLLWILGQTKIVHVCPFLKTVSTQLAGSRIMHRTGDGLKHVGKTYINMNAAHKSMPQHVVD